MNLDDSPEEAAYRARVRAWIAENGPDLSQYSTDELRAWSETHKDIAHKWQNTKADGGYACINWPVEHGGAGGTTIEATIFAQEELKAGLRFTYFITGLEMLLPALIRFAGEDVSRALVPQAVRGDVIWCQLFSEPSSGSDSAAVRTAAVCDGDDWVINGQKTWTSYAQNADWIFVLARTDMTVKKQEGISFILVDMKTPGITWRPIQTIDGGHEVNEVFFDNVRVPAENLVGQVNKGWDYAKFLLGNERTGIARIGISKARMKRIRELAEQELDGDRRLIDDPVFRKKLVSVEIELKALEMTQLRVVAQERHLEKGKPNPMSSVLKIKGSELQQATTELLMDVMGPYIAPFFDEHDLEFGNEPPVGPPDAATAAPTYFNMRKVSIYGGSNEIQRNILAKAVLGF